MSRRKFYDRAGNEITEDEAVDENGIVKDGVTMRSPIYLTDARGRTLTDAFGQPLPAGGGRSGFVFVDDTDNDQRRREDYDFAKAKLSAEWKGGLEAGDPVTIAGQRLHVLGYRRDNGKMVLGDAVDGDALKEQAYNISKQELSDAWRRRPTADVEEVINTINDIDADDGQSVDAQALKDAAWLEGVERLRNAWRK